jgi:hypothetical protein
MAKQILGMENQRNSGTDPFKELRHDRRAATHQQHCFRPKLQRLAHMGTVELCALGWIGADRVVICPAIEDRCRSPPRRTD